MSTTTLHPTASPAYRPRTFRPVSPFPPSTSTVPSLPVPRTAQPKLDYPLPSRPITPMPPSQSTSLNPARISVPTPNPEHDRKGSSLRNEVTLVRRSSIARSGKVGTGEVEEGEVREITETMKKNAKDLLKMLSNLPAPLPETLPPTFLPTPRSTPSPSPKETFASFARSQSQSPKSSSSSLLGKRRRSSSPVPLVGLGLSDMNKKSKKGISMTPTTSSFGFKTISPERRTISGKTTIEGKDTWSKTKWATAGSEYKTRAIQLKRHGDAHCRVQGAKTQFLHLPADPLLGLLSLTDAVLLWIYSYWCDEQAEGRVRTTPYSHSQALRDYVKLEWEKWVRKGWNEYTSVREEEREVLRDMGKGMIGLMYLIEAVVYQHLSSEQLSYLSRRSLQLNKDANTSNSEGSPPDPSPKSNTSHSTEIPKEIMDLISTSTSQVSKAQSNLLNSRHHLPISLLRSRFPRTYDDAIHSELSDESLPPPNDTLGAARKVDIDQLKSFVWPIELGMCAPMAHLAVFGRGLVREMAEAAGREWDVRLGEGV